MLSNWYSTVMVEVQCFDGDGAVPPELQALMKENQRLKELLEARDHDNDCLQKTNRELEKELRNFGNKLWQIQNIVNAKDVVEDEYPHPGPTKGFAFEEQFEELKTLEKDDPRNVLMNEKVPLEEAYRRAKAAHDRQSADDLFKILSQKGDA
jgi:hypothetical protein